MARAGARAPFAIALCLTMSAARADAVTDFYAGKSLTFFIGSATGGTFDTAARVVARFLPKYVPGNPSVTPQNMPGASHVRATDYLANIAPRDGTSMAFVQPSVILNKVTSPAAKYDPAAMTWIGRIAPVRNVGISATASGIHSVEATKAQELILGAAGSTGPAAMVPWALNRMIGAKMRLVRGYTDDTATFLAFERGEVQGMGSINHASLARHPGLLGSGKVKIIYSISSERISVAPDAPSIVELAQKPDDKAVMELIASIPRIGITIMGSPGVPPERAAALRKAAWEMFHDPAFVAEMKKVELEVDPLGGEALAGLVDKVMRTPDAIVELLKQQTAPID